LTFPDIIFNGTLRPTQQEVVSVVKQQLTDDQREFYVVAPPGSGKTVTGLYLWAHVFKCPALVLSPNSAIQSQWLARTDLFKEGNSDVNPSLLSSNPKNPSLLTSLTYQSVTLPSRNSSDFETIALQSWVDHLIEKEAARNPDEAMTWITNLREQNLEYFQTRFNTYLKKIRDAHADLSGGLDTLHGSSIANLRALKKQGVQLIILDECHHLLGHWGRVLQGIHEFLDAPYIIGLTATPPDESDHDPKSWERYENFMGEIDFEVPIPAVVKEGYLAPYQDLCYFTRPTDDELSYVSNTNQALLDLLEIVSQGDFETQRMSLPDFIYDTLDKRMLMHGPAKSWSEYEERASNISWVGRAYLRSVGRELPAGVPPLTQDQFDVEDLLEYVTPCLERYVRLYLMMQDNPKLHALAREIKSKLRMLGMQITETGSQQCASPISRILAYSKAKCLALQPILSAEINALGESIRAVVVCDYEKTSAVSENISHLLDDEAGGAMAAFKQLLKDEQTDQLDPILVTGSTVLVDNDLRDVFDAAAKKWVSNSQYKVTWEWLDVGEFYLMRGKGSDWSPRLYVEMITELFQQGITRCLVGTRGLLGEGWDASKINVLIDLTCAATHTAVNQLRGRSMRLDKDVPQKIANNWDVVCLAPEFLKGLDDYKRFRKKHGRIYGVTDDGVIEKGVGHVHAALTEIKPEGVEGSAAILNQDMLSRVPKRAAARELWKIGKPFLGKSQTSVETKIDIKPPAMKGRGFPPFWYAETPWDEASLTYAVSRAVLRALVETNVIRTIRVEDTEEHLTVNARNGGYVRVFMNNADAKTNRIFSEAISEVFGPIKDARYLIERQAAVGDISMQTKRPKWAHYLPNFIGKYFDYEELVKDLEVQLVMVHCVPTELARNKDRVFIFLKHWKELVGPAEVHFLQREESRDFLQSARLQGLVPKEKIHHKQIFT